MHPSLSQLMEERKLSKEAEDAEKGENAELLATTLPRADNAVEENSPYWIPASRFVERFVRIRSISNVQTINSFVNYNTTESATIFRPAERLEVLEARDSSADTRNRMWLHVVDPNDSSRFGWITSNNITFEQCPNHRLIVMVPNPDAAENSTNSIVRIWQGPTPATANRYLANADFSANETVGTRTLTPNSSIRGLVNGAFVTAAVRQNNRNFVVDEAVTRGAAPVLPTVPNIVGVAANIAANRWIEITRRWGMESRAGDGQFRRMRMSEQGVIMLMGFELTPVYGNARGIVRLDAQGNITHVYPHFVMRSRRDGQPGLESDGGITFGFGVWVSQGMYNNRSNSNYNWARDIIDRYVPNPPNFVPAHTRNTHRVPNSSAMPISEVRELFFDLRLPVFEDAVNDFLENPREGYPSVRLEQHQFDALVSFTYQLGQNTWTVQSRREWNINVLIRNGPPFDTDMEFAHRAFTNFVDSPDRRQREFEVFLMAIKKHTKRVQQLLMVVTLLIAHLLTGCNSTSTSDNISNVISADESSDTSHSFFGTWVLEEIVLIVHHEGELELPEPPALRPIIEDFIGYELEITRDFVRLGERKLHYPEYSLRKSRKDLHLFFSDEHVWGPAYYDSPNEFLDAISEYGIEIWRVDEATGDKYFESVFVSYPQYSQYWHQGWLLDPDIERNSILNPLFQNFLLLNDDYMLVGSTALVLARRIE